MSNFIKMSEGRTGGQLGNQGSTRGGGICDGWRGELSARMRDYSGRCKHGHATLYQAIRLDKGSSGMGEEGNGRREEGDKKVGKGGGGARGE